MQWGEAIKASDVKKLLIQVSKGSVSILDAVERLKTLPYEDIGCATLDTHRSLRQGHPEVVYGAGKTVSDMRAIAKRMVEKGENVLITRLDKRRAVSLKKVFRKAEYNEDARTLFIKSHPIEMRGKGTILVISAGTSDRPVAEEAAVTAEVLGNKVERLYDVGVAGLHRLLARRKEIFSANVLVVVAGMEGALPSVVAGMVERPVVAVPTSVGYGANLGGLTTLLAMLNSCSSGVSVVNIDNGFGAATVASLINRKI